MIAYCLSAGIIFAQTAVEFKNAGIEANKAKDYAKALENFEKAMAVWGSEPADYAMITNSGICAFQLKDYDKAIKYFDQLIAGNYKPENAYGMKALVYKVQKKDEEYLKVLNEAMAKFPENPKFKDDLSKYYQGAGVTQYNSGATIMKGAVDKLNAKKYKDDKDPGYKAEVDKAKKEFSTAILSFTKALEFNPADEKSKTLKATSETQLKSL